MPELSASAVCDDVRRVPPLRATVRGDDEPVGKLDRRLERGRRPDGRRIRSRRSIGVFSEIREWCDDELERGPIQQTFDRKLDAGGACSWTEPEYEAALPPDARRHVSRRVRVSNHGRSATRRFVIRPAIIRIFRRIRLRGVVVRALGDRLRREGEYEEGIRVATGYEACLTGCVGLDVQVDARDAQVQQVVGPEDRQREAHEPPRVRARSRCCRRMRSMDACYLAEYIGNTRTIRSSTQNVDEASIAGR